MHNNLIRMLLATNNRMLIKQTSRLRLPIRQGHRFLMLIRHLTNNLLLHPSRLRLLMQDKLHNRIPILRIVRLRLPMQDKLNSRMPILRMANSRVLIKHKGDNQLLGIDKIHIRILRMLRQLQDNRLMFKHH